MQNKLKTLLFCIALPSALIANPYQKCVEQCLAAGGNAGMCSIEYCDPSDTLDVVDTGQGNPLQLISFQLSGTPPTINGSLMGRAGGTDALDEWKEACSRTLILSDGGIAQLFLMNTSDTLYVGTTYEHGNNGSGSGVTLYFDEGTANPSSAFDGTSDMVLTNLGGPANEDACKISKGFANADLCWNGSAWVNDGDGGTDFSGLNYYFNSDKKVHHYEFAIPLNNGKTDDATNSDLDVSTGEALGFYLNVRKEGAGAGDWHWMETNGSRARPDSFPHWARIQLSVERQFFTFHSGRASSAVPVIDGAINETAWAGAYQRSLTFTNYHYGTFPAIVWTMEDAQGDTLYIGVRMFDKTFNAGDYCQIYFEETGENTTSLTRDYDLDDNAENSLRLTGSGQMTDLYWQMSSGRWVTDTEGADAQKAASGAGIGWIDFEYKIPRSGGAQDIDIPRNGLLGFLVRFHDGDKPSEDLANFYWEYTTNNDAQLLSQHQSPYRYLSTGWINLQLGGPNIEVRSPLPGQGIFDSAGIEVFVANGTATSVKYFLASDTAHQVDLAQTGGGLWRATWDLSTVPNGAKVLVIRVIMNGIPYERLVSVSVVAPDRQAPQIMLLWPMGGEVLAVGSIQTVSWNATDNEGIVAHSIYRKKGASGTWTLIDTGASSAGTGQWNWTIPTDTSSLNWLRVSVYDAAGNSASDTLNAPMAIMFLPCFTMPDSASTTAGQRFGVKIRYSNPLEGTPAIQYQKPSWAIAVGDTIFGTPPLAGVDTITAILSVNNQIYDTLRLRIIIAAPSPGLVPQGRRGVPRNLGLMAGARSKTLILALEKTSDLRLKVWTADGRLISLHKLEQVSPGFHRIALPRSMQAGVYVAALERGPDRIVRRFAVMH